MTTLFNYDPYFDDFDEDKNFMRVLFRPGYSVQARELTQIQTILQNQIEKFGNHIFKSGSPIVGGKISLDDKANYITLNSQYDNQDIVPSDFLDKTIISYNSSKSVRAKVVAVDTTSANPILVVKYLSGDVFSENDELKISGQNIFASLRSANAVGRSYIASVQEGVYYFKGQFVKVVPQFLVVELFYRIGYNSTTINSLPSYKIGIEFDDTIIDEVDDTSLLDPAQGAFNYQAPGANRYQIQTTLAKRTLDSADESSFFEVIRLVDGVKTKEIDYPIYSEIEKTLARRTYDESGNYTVDPFVISLEEGDSANGKFNAILDPGKAYVGGYEYQTIAPTTIEVDRARETTSVSDYDIATNYTSSIVLDTIRGSLDISAFTQLDIHSVPITSVNVSTTTAYNSTKIGTLRASMMKYNDATTTDVGTTHSFTVNVFDVNNTPITGTLPSSGSTTTVVKVPSSWSATAPANTYANMYFRITDAGGSSLAPILITQSSTTANTITLASALPFIPASNTFSIDPDFKVAESVINRNGTSILFGGNINSDSKETTTGYAFITEPNRSALIFDLPFDAIKAGTISNLDLFTRKVYSNKLSGGDGIITITTEGTDTFNFGSTGSTLSDSVILDNIICFIRSDSASNGTSGITPNTICSLANNLFTVTKVSSTTLDIDFNTAGVRADFLITSKINNADNSSTGALRGKQLIPLTTGADLHAKVPFELGGADTLEAANSATKTSFTGGVVYEDIGSTFFENGTSLTNLKTPGVAVSLQVPDVYEIVRITDSLSTSSNVTTAMLSSSTYDVTDNYEFNNGQKKTHYDHATIKLKRGYSSPKGKIYVQYKYLKHQSAPSPQNDGLFTVDSYLKPGSNFTYDEISVFDNSSDSKLVQLRSALDFRPTRAIGGTTLSGAVNPDPDLTSIASFEYYLGRVDQLVVKPSREFSVIKGKSSVSPIAPPIGDTDMLIYTMNIPAYTESVKDVRADFKNNRRYTMRDIGTFDTRVKQLEYYVALDSLEKNAAATKVLDANGLERSKYGILVDNFSTTDSQATYSDVGYDNRCLIENGELKPASLMRTFKMKLISGACSGAFNIVGTGEKKLLMLDYTTTEFAKQPYATKTTPIAAALFANFQGQLKLFPEFAGDVDTDKTARVTLNSNQGIESAFNFINDAFKYIADNNKQWADDKNSPFAKTIDSKWYTTKHIDFSRNGVWLGGNVWGNLRTSGDQVWLSAGAESKQKQITTSTTEVDTGTFVTDLAIQPYVKPRQIIFTSEGVRPNTTFYSFFDDVSVNQYVIVPNKVTLNVSSGFLSGEQILIANTISDLAANAASFINGGTSYDLVTMSAKEIGTNTAFLVNETGKPLANKFIFGLDSGTIATISSVNEHRSGRLTTNVSNSSVTLASDAPSVNIAGNTIYLIHETGSEIGLGTPLSVVSYNTTSKVAVVSGNLGTTNKSFTYSFGTNKSNRFGQVSGAFYPPAATFRSGERNFRVSESFNNTYDTDAISFAEHSYVASGVKVNKTTLVDTVYNVGVAPKVVGTTTSPQLISSTVQTRITAAWAIDPLAQTFYVDPQVYPNGMFLDSVDLFFKNVDDSNLPVTIQIRPTINGAPHTDFWYPESVVSKYPSQINVSDSPSATIASTKTNFKFSTPVFLKPGLYALVVMTDSPDYTMWVAEKGATTTRNEFVGVNPYVGTLYKSQNSMEYVPIINEDMMFVMNRCVFSTSTANFSLQSEVQTQTYPLDKFRLVETSLDTLTNAPIKLNHTFISKPIGLPKETTYRSFSPYVTYSMGQDDLYVVGSRRKEIRNQGDFSVNIEMASSDNAISPVVSLESVYLNAWENFIDDGVIEASDFNIIAPGSGYSNSNTITVTSSTGTGAEIYLIVDGVKGNVIGINVASSGSGYTDDFTISYPNTGTTANVTSNASIVLNSEYDSGGGICDAKYITKPITLADGFDAGDLRIFLSANKQGSSEIEVFYKILSSTDTTDFKDRPYVKMECYNPTVTPSINEFDFREYEYKPSLTTNSITYTTESGTTYDSFKTFAIKIVMTSNDKSIVPKIKDLRIIALPAE
jgi:hypothetical protein